MKLYLTSLINLPHLIPNMIDIVKNVSQSLIQNLIDIVHVHMIFGWAS
jgi:hypothetical protein